MRVRIGSGTDTLDAAEALKVMRLKTIPEFPGRYVRLKVAEDSTIVYDLTWLKNGLPTADFGRLMMFDMLVNSMKPGQNRQIYWIGALDSGRRLGLTEHLSPWIFGQRFGVTPETRSDSSLIAEAAKVIPANPVGKKVYMDHAAELLVASQRGALIATARRLLDHGHVADAIRIADMAETRFDNSPGTYLTIIINDTTFHSRAELGALLLECADSLHAVSAYDKAKIIELRARGAKHLRDAYRLREEWNLYRRQLPARLRNKMAPVY